MGHSPLTGGSAFALIAGKLLLHTLPDR